MSSFERSFNEISSGKKLNSRSKWTTTMTSVSNEGLLSNKRKVCAHSNLRKTVWRRTTTTETIRNRLESRKRVWEVWSYLIESTDNDRKQLSNFSYFEIFDKNENDENLPINRFPFDCQFDLAPLNSMCHYRRFRRCLSVCMTNERFIKEM